MNIGMENLYKSVDFLVVLEGGEMHYVGEFDMTDWNKGWDEAWSKASEISDAYECDIELMQLDLLDNWLQYGSNATHIHNRLNQKNDSGWFTFEVCMERHDAEEIKRLLDNHTDSQLLKDLLDNYQRWDKL